MVDYPTVIEMNQLEWVEKMPGIFIREAPGTADLTLDIGLFRASYPMHRFRTRTESLYIRRGECDIVYQDGYRDRLSVGARVTIPPDTAFALELIPGGADEVEMLIACTPAWSADDVEMLE